MSLAATSSYQMFHPSHPKGGEHMDLLDRIDMAADIDRRLDNAFSDIGELQYRTGEMEREQERTQNQTDWHESDISSLQDQVNRLSAASFSAKAQLARVRRNSRIVNIVLVATIVGSYIN